MFIFRGGPVGFGIVNQSDISQALPSSFFSRAAELVGPDLVGCRLVKRQLDGSLLSGVIVETEAYSQDEPACHGYRRRTPSNETLFGELGRFYVYVSYGIRHCLVEQWRKEQEDWLEVCSVA